MKKKIGHTFVDAYSVYTIGREFFYKDYDKCLRVLRHAGILQFDDEADSDRRAEICGKIAEYDWQNKRLYDDLIEKLVVESEEMKALREIHERVSKMEKYKERARNVDLNQMMTEFFLLHEFAFNNAIVGSMEHSAYPLTDDPLFLSLFETKTRHLSRIRISKKSENVSMIETALASAKSQIVASEAFSVCVPFFYKIPVEQIVEICENEKHALRNLLQEIQKLGSLVEWSEWDKELEEKIKKMVNDEVRRRVADIQEAIGNAYYDMVKKVGEAEIAVATAGLAGLVLQGVPSFLAVLGASSLYALRNVWSYFVEREKLKENSLYYVFKVSQLQDQYLKP